jgi:hypothetical protein
VQSHLSNFKGSDITQRQLPEFNKVNKKKKSGLLDESVIDIGFLTILLRHDFIGAMDLYEKINSCAFKLEDFYNVYVTNYYQPISMEFMESITKNEFSMKCFMATEGVYSSCPANELMAQRILMAKACTHRELYPKTYEKFRSDRETYEKTVGEIAGERVGEGWKALCDGSHDE